MERSIATRSDMCPMAASLSRSRLSGSFRICISTELPSPKSEEPPGRLACLPLEFEGGGGERGDLIRIVFGEGTLLRGSRWAVTRWWSRSADATIDVRTYLTASFWFQLDIPDVRTRRRPRVDESDRG